jgi:hypothetical protein
MRISYKTFLEGRVHFNGERSENSWKWCRRERVKVRTYLKWICGLKGTGLRAGEMTGMEGKSKVG